MRVRGQSIREELEGAPLCALFDDDDSSSTQPSTSLATENWGDTTGDLEERDEVSVMGARYMVQSNCSDAGQEATRRAVAMQVETTASGVNSWVLHWNL